MKFLAPLLLSVVVVTASPLAAAEPALATPLVAASAAVPPALYSFNDVYRLTVSRAPMAVNAGQPLPHAGEAPVRVAAAESAAAESASAEPRFTVRQFPAPARWLLVLAGLALAGWVAHRRLSYL